MTPHRILAALCFAFLVVTALAEGTVKDREAAVRKDTAAMQDDALWRYNDHEAGFAEARRTGKPLLVVLRCVPCLSCMGLDAGVLSAEELKPLLRQFVCVRLINANAIDLARFQFDYDLSFSAIMFNGDGTVYARYGSWKHQKDSSDKTTTGFKRALEGGLKLHAGYPQNQAALAGKQGGQTPFKSPLEIPGLAGRYKRDLDWDGKVLASCVHCHMVGEAYRNSFRVQSKPIPTNLIFPMPMPETIGITLAPDQMALVQGVAAGSIAARSGIRAGDQLLALDRQPLVSPADVSWALHRAPDDGMILASLRSGQAERSVRITLPDGWRTKADISKRVGTWDMRGMATGGLVLADLGDEERSQRGLALDALALKVMFVGQYNRHAAAKNAGFQKDDILVDIGGKTGRMTEGQFIGHLLQTTKPGLRVATTVLRGSQRVRLQLPMQ